MTLLSAAATAGMLTIGVVSSGKTSAPMYPFAEQIIGRDLCCTKYDILNQPIDARRSIEAWRIHYNQVRLHSAGRYISPEQFGLAGQTGYGKAGRFATVENSPNFPLSHNLDGGRGVDLNLEAVRQVGWFSRRLRRKNHGGRVTDLPSQGTVK